MKKITIMPISLLFLFAFSLLGCKGQMNKKNPENDVNHIGEIASKFNLPNPSISYMVIKNGEIVVQKSLGYADVENKTKASSKTNYRIASVSKTFTATAILRLISKGKLKYSTTLSEIFPGFPEYGDAITVEHLLTHRSGILEYYQFFEEGKQMSDEKVLEGLMSINSISAYPNEKFEYRNSGYALLAQIIEKISGKEFEDYMADEIFKPIGMKNTNLYIKGKEITYRAYGYTIENDSVKKTDQSQGTAVKGDGCIYSSLEDFYYWDQALYSDIIMPQEELDDAFYGYDKDGKTDEKGYGYGWEVDYNNGIKVVQHTGASLGFTNQITSDQNLQILAMVF